MEDIISKALNYAEENFKQPSSSLTMLDLWKSKTKIINGELEVQSFDISKELILEYNTAIYNTLKQRLSKLAFLCLIENKKYPAILCSWIMTIHAIYSGTHPITFDSPILITASSAAVLHPIINATYWLFRDAGCPIDDIDSITYPGHLHQFMNSWGKAVKFLDITTCESEEEVEHLKEKILQQKMNWFYTRYLFNYYRDKTETV